MKYQILTCDTGVVIYSIECEYFFPFRLEQKRALLEAYNASEKLTACFCSDTADHLHLRCLVRYATVGVAVISVILGCLLFWLGIVVLAFGMTVIIYDSWDEMKSSLLLSYYEKKGDADAAIALVKGVM